MNIYCCCLQKKVNKLAKMVIPNFAFINFQYEYLLLLFTQISKQLMKIHNQPRF